MASAPPETCPPQLAELSRALDSLSQEKIRYMCVELGVPPATLSNIDASHPGQALRCITGYLEALLAYHDSLTWERIVDVLSSSRLKELALASEIRKTHCLSVVDGDRPTTPPLSPSVRGSTGVVNSGTRKGGCTGRVRTKRAKNKKMPCHTPPTCSVDKFPHPHEIDVGELMEKITDFKKKFRQVVVVANFNLSQKMSQDDLKFFKFDLSNSPMGETHEILLQREKGRIQEAQSVQDIFDILHPYWNHVDYELLDHIVQEYCDGVIKQQMENYKSELHEFEKATPVQQFTSVAANFYPLPPGYSTLTLTLKIDARECSLYDARQMKNSITQRANLKPYVMLLHGLHASAVVLTIGFPRAVSELIRRALDSEFLSEVGIVPSSLRFSDSPQPAVPLPTHKQEKSIPGDYFITTPDGESWTLK